MTTDGMNKVVQPLPLAPNYQYWREYGREWGIKDP